MLRPVERADLMVVQDLLVDLPRDYPAGDRWLGRRLLEVLDGRPTDRPLTAGRPSGRVAYVGEVLVAVTLAITKPTGAVKLSTIYVHPTHRNAGLGAAMLDAHLDEVSAAGKTETYVTVAHHKVPQLDRLLTSRGFTQVATEENRYGPGRHEVVYSRLGLR